MSILKYKDPKTGEFKRINPYKADLSFVGKDGIVVNKAADSEKIEISGSGLIPDMRPGVNNLGAPIVPIKYNGKSNFSYKFIRDKSVSSVNGADLIGYDGGGAAYVPNVANNDRSITNKKYVDDNFVNKLKFTNLEQALNGYILDTTKEAYADLDSAVLKDSVAVGDNVYPIADKTRALVTRIEGKTTKMVQLLDKSTYSSTQTKSGITATNNGDGSWTINGTATESGYINFSSPLSLNDGHKVLLTGNKTDSGFVLGLLNQQISDTGNGAIGIINAGFLRTWGISWSSGAVINNVTITPQLFDLTAMNREDITTVEQFKAEFPDLYPYENGNIYPAKISGVKFTGKNLFDSNTNNLIFNTGNVEVVGNNIIITGNKLNARFTYKAIPLIIGETYTVSVSNYTKENSDALGLGISYDTTADRAFALITETNHTFTFTAKSTQLFIKGYITYNAGDAKITISNLQVETGGQATAYEPYIEPVSVTLPETYELHGVGDYKDYLEITKNKDNELYTLKKVQSVEVNESEKTVTPLATPVETVIATNLTYEQVTAIRHNGGLIEVVGNTNKGYARPTIKNTIVYRLTATNTAEG